MGTLEVEATCIIMCNDSLNLLTSTCFEHVSDDCFFFISLQVFERETVSALHFI